MPSQASKEGSVVPYEQRWLCHHISLFQDRVRNKLAQGLGITVLIQSKAVRLIQLQSSEARAKKRREPQRASKAASSGRGSNYTSTATGLFAQI